MSNNTNFSNPTIAIEEGLTFDDVLLIPGYSDFLPREADISTRLTNKLTLHTPLLSAAMDSVTTASMAIALAHEGGLGIIHKNNSVERQVASVRRVKKFESGIIDNPITLPLNISVLKALQLADKNQISGFPVVDKLGELVGIVTRRDLRYVENKRTLIADVMTPKSRLVVVEENKTNTKQQRNLLHKHRIERLLVVNNLKDFELKGMITVKDINQVDNFPLASRDHLGRLLVGAAIGTENNRYKELIEAGVDVIVIDTAHGHSKKVLDQVCTAKSYNSQVQVIAGNIATAEAALALKEAGADAVKVGIGPGSICTTRIVAGVGFPQITAISNVAKALKGSDIGIIADGGIRFSGDLGKAIATGASAVMIGSILAGTDEAPGEVEYYQGRPYKSYRGMGSIAAMSESYGSSDRYFQEEIKADKLVPEGIEGRVPYKGSVHTIIHQLTGGLKSCMGYTGCRTIAQLQSQAKLVRLTNSGIVESHVHDVSITKEAPNYRV